MGADLLDYGLDYLRRYGWSILPVRGKEAAGVWKCYQKRRPTEKELHRQFERRGLSGLAVILGDVSGGLWARDFDKAEAFPKWAAAFPDVTLPTVTTARGVHLYGCWPGVTFCKLPDGELRAGGGYYCLLPPSKHPDGPTYTWATGPPATIPRLNPAVIGLDRTWGSVTQSTDTPAPPDVTQNADCRMQSPEPSGIEEGGGEPEHPERQGGVPLSVLLRTIPDGPHQNHDALFHLARRIRGLEEERGERYSMADFTEAATAWCAANPNLRDGMSPEDYAIELMAAYGCVRVPYGGEPTLDVTWKLAQQAPYPPEVAAYGEAVGRLACWCRELARVGKGRPFYLSARSVQEYFKLSAPLSAWRRLQFLCGLGVIELVEVGDRRRASTFRYRLPLT